MNVQVIKDDGNKPLAVESGGSCNAGLIVGLSYHYDSYWRSTEEWSAEKMMQRFMKAGAYGLMPFYIFQGVVGTTGGSKVSDKLHYSYCQQFVAYIRRHKLGKVTSGPKHINETYHKDHIGQVFIWTIDIKALKDWYIQHPIVPEKTAAQKLEEAAAAKVVPQADVSVVGRVR